MEYKNKKSHIIFPLIIAVTLLCGVLLGVFINSKTTSNENQIDWKSLLETNLTPPSKLGTVISLIDSKYVEKINVDTLTEEYIQKILTKLDPHSYYIPAKDAVESFESLAGAFDGIGVVFNMATDTVIIQSVVSGGPSEKMGVLAGDRIITVGDSIIAGRKVNQDSVVKMLKGPGGTKVKIGIERGGGKQIIPFEITRGKVVQKSVDAAFMMTPTIGYIKLLKFSRTSHKEFVEAVSAMQKEGMKELIFDLTLNTGGYLDQAIYIANEFLPSGNMIVYTEGINSPINKTFATGTGSLIGLPIMLLIDENSASASEIVAGALQDNDIGTIVGRRSFGKGLVQEQIPFTDGSAINLTIARYHTPTGRCIQRPYDDGIEEYTKDFYNRYIHSELVNQDSIKLSDSLKYTTPKGKIVYGGGGIMPDVFVPMDTTGAGKYFIEVMNNNSLFNYTLRYTDAHRSELQALDTKEKLEKYFTDNSDIIFDGFIKFASAKGVKNRIDQKSRENSEMFLKAYIARNSTWGDNGFYLFMHPYNNIITKALYLLKEQ